MGRQSSFGGMFRDLTFGPREGFSPREWQMEADERHSESVAMGGEGQHTFCLYAGTGSGKTKAAGLIAARMLNAKLVEQVVIVCPNRAIRQKTRKDFAACFGIDLVTFHAKKYADGVPRSKQGYILTYNHLFQDPTLHRRICGITPTLVIFDEVHHLGDASTWGQAALEAFGGVPYVLSLTGTPYRSDNTVIPFVTYEPGDGSLMRFRADYVYSLGRAVADGVCRKPMFCFSTGTVQIRIGTDSGHCVVGFDDASVPADLAAYRLRGAVRFGSEPRKRLLAEALTRCKAENRKAIVFLGGDTEGDQTPTEDACNFLPGELEELGITGDEYEVVTGDDKEAHRKIEQFGASSKWVLVSINLVSEGVDIPELSAAVFLTSVTAKQTTAQRIGRVLRLASEDSPPFALIFMFADPELMAFADELEREIEHEIRLKRRRDEAAGQDGTPDRARNRVEAIGISGGEICTVKCNGQEWPIEAVDEKRRVLLRRGLPATLHMSVLSLILEGNTCVAGHEQP